MSEKTRTIRVMRTCAPGKRPSWVRSKVEAEGDQEGLVKGSWIFARSEVHLYVIIARGLHALWYHCHSNLSFQLFFSILKKIRTFEDKIVFK